MTPEVRALKKRLEKLRDALAPFASLQPKELRMSDFNKAKRVLDAERMHDASDALEGKACA